jgi:hypothetical protein
MKISLLPKQKITLTVSKESDDEFYEVIPLQLTNTADYPLTFSLLLQNPNYPGNMLLRCENFQYPEV